MEFDDWVKLVRDNPVLCLQCLKAECDLDFGLSVEKLINTWSNEKGVQCE